MLPNFAQAGTDTRRRAFRPAVEALEDRAVPAALTDVQMTFATTDDSHGVTFQYNLTRRTDSLDVGVYRSADSVFDAGDLAVGSFQLSGRDTARGRHTVTRGGIDLAQDPTRPYVLVVADPEAQLAEANEANNTAFFRKHLIGVVTHGFQLQPGVPEWATSTAAGLEALGYDEAFAYNWDALSKVPLPGMSTLAAYQLAARINATAAGLDLAPGDVVDLHLIGHSRGTVVNSLAADFVSDSPLLDGGWVRETMLDAHPARLLEPAADAVADVLFGPDNISEGAFFAFRPGPLGQVPMLGIIAAQRAMNDPAVYFAENVDQAEVLWQNTPDVQEPFDPLNMDSYANSWGYRPEMIANLSDAEVESRDLTGLFHYQVPEYYLANLPALVLAPW